MCRGTNLHRRMGFYREQPNSLFIDQPTITPTTGTTFWRKNPVPLCSKRKLEQFADGGRIKSKVSLCAGHLFISGGGFQKFFSDDPFLQSVQQEANFRWLQIFPWPRCAVFRKNGLFLFGSFFGIPQYFMWQSVLRSSKFIKRNKLCFPINGSVAPIDSCLRTRTEKLTINAAYDVARNIQSGGVSFVRERIPFIFDSFRYLGT